MPKRISVITGEIEMIRCGRTEDCGNPLNAAPKIRHIRENKIRGVFIGVWKMDSDGMAVSI